jgi:FtsH-binding integral membrane protein
MNLGDDSWSSAVIIAVNLYLDIINLFLDLLMILAEGGN